jgi:hypothetical protein
VGRNPDVAYFFKRDSTWHNYLLKSSVAVNLMFFIRLYAFCEESQRMFTLPGQNLLSSGSEQKPC